MKNIEIYYKGRTMTLREWSDALGIPYTTMRARYKRDGVCWKLFSPTRGKVKARELIRELL
jgi:predicted site-specific integrase-resolvase